MSNTSTDAALAFCIGALVGVGAALLLEVRDDADDEASIVIRQLRRHGFKAHVASRDDSRKLRAAIECARRVSRGR